MRILISGAGIGGPVFAWYRAQSSNQVKAHITIVEKAAELLPIGQNIDVNGSALRVMRKMGLIEELAKFNTTETGTEFVDDAGKTVAAFPVVKDSTFSATSEYEILRGDLAMILYRATKDMDNVEYRFGTTVTSIKQGEGDGPVKVKLSSVEEEQEYDLVVAADGQWSNVRKQVFPKSDITVIDKGMYGIYWTLPKQPEDTTWWKIYQALNRRVVTVRPDPHGTLRTFVSKYPNTAAEKAEWQHASRGTRQEQEKLAKREFADVGWIAPRILNTMSDATDYYFQAIQQIKMRKWSAGRVVCLGDAAHAPTPLTGMGTSLAIEGAYVLAGELSKLEPGQHPGVALEAYETKFRPFVEKIQDIPWFVPGIAHPRTKPQRWLFWTVVRAVAAVIRVITNTPFLAKWFGGSSEEKDEGFPLPPYAAFDDLVPSPPSSTPPTEKKSISS